MKKRVVINQVVSVARVATTVPQTRRAGSLLDRDETRRVRRTNTGATVQDRPVAHRKLGEVVANHLTLDLHSVELVAVVDRHNGPHHLRSHNNIAQVRLHRLWLLTNLHVLLRLAQALQQHWRAALRMAVHVAARTGVHQRLELILAQREQRVDLQAAVRELVERTLLLELLVALRRDVGGHYSLV